MAKARMDLTAFVGKLLEEQDGDVPPDVGRSGLTRALERCPEAGASGPTRRRLPHELQWLGARLGHVPPFEL